MEHSGNTDSSCQEPSPIPSLILDVPSEIRLRIYEFVFQGNCFHIAGPKDCQCNPCSRSKSKPKYKILLTCRLIHDEARPILYGSTLWIFQGLPRAWKFVDKPRFREGPKYVKYISLSLFGHLERQVLNRLPSLENVIIRRVGPSRLSSSTKEDSLSDANILYRVREEILCQKSFRYLCDLLSERRKYSMSLVVKFQWKKDMVRAIPISYLLSLTQCL